MEMITEISAENLAELLRAEGYSFQNVKVIEKVNKHNYKSKRINFYSRNMSCDVIGSKCGSEAIPIIDGFKCYPAYDDFSIYTSIPAGDLGLEEVNLLNKNLHHCNAYMFDGNIFLKRFISIEKGVSKEFLIEEFIGWRLDVSAALEFTDKARTDLFIAREKLEQFFQNRWQNKE